MVFIIDSKITKEETVKYQHSQENDKVEHEFVQVWLRVRVGLI